MSYNNSSPTTSLLSFKKTRALWQIAAVGVRLFKSTVLSPLVSGADPVDQHNGPWVGRIVFDKNHRNIYTVFQKSLELEYLLLVIQ